MPSLSPSVLLAASCALAWAAVLYAVARTVRAVPRLREVAGLPRLSSPRPSVHAVVAARDEAATIERALASLAGQPYSPLTVSVVDDRSTDGTGDVIARVAAAASNVRPQRVDALPDGWLGKVHALHVATTHSAVAADWLLFTDADVRFADGALSLAVAFAESRRLDLLTAYPEVESAGLLADAAFDFVATLMGPAARPWRWPDPAVPDVGAAGAFILVRASAWVRTPGFSALRLEVADDFGIAALVKRAGGTCRIVNGNGLVRLRWYTSAADLVARTQKNLWAVIGHCSAARSLAVMAGLGALAFGPYALLAVPSAAVRTVALTAVALATVASLGTAHWLGRRWVPAVLVPVGAAVLLVAFARAVALGIRTGGVRWRDTFYSNERLRAGRLISY